MIKEIKIGNYIIWDMSYVTKGADPTEVTVYHLSKFEEKSIFVEEFFGDWKITTGLYSEVFQNRSEADTILQGLGAPTTKIIQNAFEFENFDTNVRSSHNG